MRTLTRNRVDPPRKFAVSTVPEMRAASGTRRIFSGRSAGAARFLQNVDLADEVGDEARARAVVDLGRAPTCSTLPWFITAMRSVMASASSWSWVTKTRVTPSRLLQLLELELHLLAELAVERAERLVAQQHRRPDHERAGQRHALLLAARELAGLALLRPVSATWARAARPRRSMSRLATSRMRKPKATFSATVRCGNRRIGLEHHAHVALVHGQVGDVAAADVDAARSGVSKPAIMRSDVVLPQPDGPSSEKNSPAAMSSVTPVDGRDPAVEGLGHVVESDGG